jgi:hypothetical protein
MSVVVTPRASSTSGLPLFNVPQSKMYSFTGDAVCGVALQAKSPAEIDKNSFTSTTFCVSSSR